MAGQRTATINITPSGTEKKKVTQNTGSQSYLDSIAGFTANKTAYDAYDNDTTGNTPPPDFNYGNTKLSGGGGVTASSYYDKVLQEQQKAIQARIDAAVQKNNAYVPQVNQRSDQSLQNAYILREQNRVNAPQALSAMGYNGGATETSLMGINTGYENTRNEVEQNRQNSLNEIYQNEQQIRATGDATLSEASADYYNKLVQAQQAAEAAQQDQMQWQADYEMSQKEYEDAAAQQQWQNAYDERLLGLKQQTASKSGGSGSAGSSSTSDANKTSAYYTSADRLLSTLSVPSSMTALIRQYNSDGRLSDAEATALLRKYGLTW